MSKNSPQLKKQSSKQVPVKITEDRATEIPHKITYPNLESDEILENLSRQLENTSTKITKKQ